MLPGTHHRLYSRQQGTRLVKRARRGGVLAKRYAAPTPGSARKFWSSDVALLAETDALHGTLSGPATRCLMERAVAVFGDTRYERLSTISVAHLCNLRRAGDYEARWRHWTQTRGHSVPIAKRRALAPDHRPSFIRIDSCPSGKASRENKLINVIWPAGVSSSSPHETSPT